MIVHVGYTGPSCQQTPEEKLLWDIFSNLHNQKEEHVTLEIKDGHRKPFDIKYVQVTEENISDVKEWCGGVVGGEGSDVFVKVIDKNAINQRQTKAFIGDYMVWSEESKSYKAFGKKSFHKAFATVAFGDVYHKINGLEGSVDDVAEHYRDAGSGRYVSQEFADENPATTVKETDELPADAGLGEKEGDS